MELLSVSLAGLMAVLSCKQRKQGRQQAPPGGAGGVAPESGVKCAPETAAAALARRQLQVGPIKLVPTGRDTARVVS